MKRTYLCLALFCLLAAGGEVRSSAAQQIAPRPLPQPQQNAPRPTPQRFRISSFGVWVRTNATGKPAYRYTYSGQADGLSPPAIFTYGYEHTMQENGPNTLNGPWIH
jgi:hypothetical protein